MSVVGDEMFVEVLRGICLCAGVWLQLIFFFRDGRQGCRIFFLDVMQITCEREVYTQERTETRRDRYCWPLLGDGTVFLKRRRVVPLPDAFLGGV